MDGLCAVHVRLISVFCFKQLVQEGSEVHVGVQKLNVPRCQVAQPAVNMSQHD